MLRTVLLADLADSTQFVERLGDAAAAALWQRLDLQIRDLLEFTGGRLIDKADGLLALFERPVQAVDFALRYQHALHDAAAELKMELKARIGIHVGDVMTWANSPQAVAAGAKPLEVEGLAKPVAARLMNLATPGQILMSGMAQTLAYRAQAELGSERAAKLRWLVHGRYRFKGVPAPMIVHEVGEPGFSPLRLPPSGQKSWREVPLWRRPPMLALEVLCVLGVVGGTLYTTLRSPPALAFHERDWVVVGDMNNFTDDPRLDESLETALRVSLEQSRYVNLVSDIKVRDALTRMGRDPQTTIDRGIGSEIALREGARALLLPSITEVGGQLRVNLEVVDPNTQVTVYAESAEGHGQDSALASIDEVNSDLREKLGEALGDIRANGKPLAQVTTPDIDALQMYSQANEAARQSKLQEARRLLDLALAKDPQFALAYSSRAKLHLVNSDYAAAKADLAMAQRYRARLSNRESLILDARAAESGPPEPLLEHWNTYARMYPDAFTAYLEAANVQAYSLQRYEAALASLRPAVSSQNPRQASTMYLIGKMNLALGRYKDAQVAFDKYESLGGRGFNRDHADLFAAQRRYVDADAVLHKQDATGLAGADLEMRLPEATYRLDRGEWRAGLDALGALQKQALQSAPMLARVYAGAELGLRVEEGASGVLPDVQRFIETERLIALQTDHPERQHGLFAALYGASLAARLGDTATARRVLTQLRQPALDSGYPALANMTRVVDAELALSEHQPERAIAALVPTLDGSELNLVHAVLLRAYLQAKSPADAAREADWLADHRGRAFVEWGSEYLLQPVNVVQSSLALLSAAEIAQAQGDVALAKTRRAQFVRAWPQPPGFVAGRLAKLKP